MIMIMRQQTILILPADKFESLTWHFMPSENNERDIIEKVLTHITKASTMKRAGEAVFILWHLVYNSLVNVITFMFPESSSFSKVFYLAYNRLLETTTGYFRLPLVTTGY